MGNPPLRKSSIQRGQGRKDCLGFHAGGNHFQKDCCADAMIRNSRVSQKTMMTLRFAQAVTDKFFG
jgi:hypothetical protein